MLNKRDMFSFLIGGAAGLYLLAQIGQGPVPEKGTEGEQVESQSSETLTNLAEDVKRKAKDFDDVNGGRNNEFGLYTNEVVEAEKAEAERLQRERETDEERIEREELERIAEEEAIEQERIAEEKRIADSEEKMQLQEEVANELHNRMNATMADNPYSRDRYTKVVVKVDSETAEIHIHVKEDTFSSLNLNLKTITYETISIEAQQWYRELTEQYPDQLIVTLVDSTGTELSKYSLDVLKMNHTINLNHNNPNNFNN